MGLRYTFGPFPLTIRLAIILPLTSDSVDIMKSILPDTKEFEDIPSGFNTVGHVGKSFHNPMRHQKYTKRILF